MFTNYFGLSLRLPEKIYHFKRALKRCPCIIKARRKKKKKKLQDKNSASLFTSSLALSIWEETSQLWVPVQLPRKQMPATETCGCVRKRFMTQDEIFLIAYIFPIKKSENYILRCPVLYFRQLPPGMDPSVGDPVSMGNSQNRKPWSLGSKNNREDDWSWFSSKNFCPVLTGHIPSTINVEWMLSHSKIRLINYISFTFRLSLKKKWEHVHISKPGLRYFCYYCAARAECRLPDMEKGWLYFSFQADKITSSCHFIYLFVLLALHFHRFHSHCFRTKRAVMTNMVVMFHLIPKGVFFFQWWASASSHVEIWLTKHDLWLAYFKNCFLLQALLRACVT